MHTDATGDRAYEPAELTEMSAEDQFRLVHATQFPAGIYPAAAILPMSYGLKTDWEFHPAWGDVDAQWAWASTRLDMALYRVSGAQPASLGWTARGKKDTALAVANLLLDLDTTRGVHKPEAMPCMTDAQALDIIAAYPLPPTGVIDTGGGLLAWWSLDAAFDPHIEHGRALLQRHKDVLAGLHHEAGVAFDATVPADPVQVVRLPVGVNGKPLPVVGGEWTAERVAKINPDITTAPVHLVRLDTRNRYAAEQISEAISDPSLPLLPARTSKRRKQRKGERPHVCGGTDRPADQVCLELPMARLMRELPGVGNAEGALISWADAALIPDDADDWPLTWAHESEGGVTYAKLFYGPWPPEPGQQPGPSISTLTPFGTGTAQVFHAEANTTRLCSWRFIRNVCCDGRGVVAHNLVKRFAGDPDGLVAALTKYRTSDDLLAAHPELAETSASSVAAGESAVVNPTVQEAMDAWDGQTIRVDPTYGHGLYSVFGGRKHGIWGTRIVSYEDDSGEVHEKEVHDHIWPAIMLRLPAERYFDGELEVSDPIYEVVVLTADGTRHSAGHQLIEDSVLSPLRCLVRSAAPVRQWHPGAIGKMQDVLQVLGAGEDGRAFQTSMGWHEGTTYVAATADMTAAGPVPGTLRVAPEPANTARGRTVVIAGRLQHTLAHTGWPEVPADLVQHRRAAGVVKAFLGLTPRRPDIGVTILGTIFAAPLGLPSRPAVVLQGPSEIGKTLYILCAQAFISSVGVRSGRLSFSLAGVFSAKGCAAVMRQHDNSTFFINDYALNGPPKRDADATEAVNAALKAAFEGTEGGVSTQHGWRSARRDPCCAVIVSAEERASGQGILNRCIELRMVMGDLVLGVRDPGGWVAEWDDSGLARMFFGGFLVWLAQKRVELGHDGMTAWANEVTRNMDKMHGVSRATGVVATVATGWAVLRQYAVVKGFEDLLPSVKEVARVLGGVVEITAERNAEEAPVEVFLAAAREWMATGAAYVDGPQHMPLSTEDPDLLAFGWRKNTFDEAEHPHNAICLGLVQPAETEGGRLILLQKQGIEKLWRATGRPEKVGQVYAALEERYVADEHRGVVAPQLGLTTGTPPRGFAVKPDALGLMCRPYTTLATRVNGARSAEAPPPVDIVPPTRRTHPTPPGGAALAESETDTTTGPTPEALIEAAADTDEADAEDSSSNDYYAGEVL